MDRVETLISFFGDRRDAGARALPGDHGLTDEQSAVIAEACSRSAVVWLRPDGDVRRRLAWHAWHAGAVHVVYGVGEQMLPMLTSRVEVTVPSKENRAALVVFVADAVVVPATSPDWPEAAEALRAARLNTPDPQAQSERWSTGCLISKLVPRHVIALGTGSDDEPSAAAPAGGGQGVTTGWRPWHLGGRAGRSAG